MTIRDDDILTAANRATALSALAAVDQKITGDCLSSEVMAALVAGNVDGPERQNCLDHLAGCQSCYDEWRALAMDERPEADKIVKGPWLKTRSFSFAAAGTLLAAAASVIFYLNSAPPPVMESQAPSSVMVDREDSAEMASDASDALRSPPKKAPSTFSLQKPARTEQTSTARHEARKEKVLTDLEELFADSEMEGSMSAENDDALKRRQRTASAPTRAKARLAEEKMAEAGSASVAEENEIMVDIGNVIPVVLQKIAQLGEGQSLVLQTFKRDRSLTLIPLDRERILIREEGFAHQEFEVARPKLKKTLRSLLKKEFPRSNKVRISFGGQYEVE